MANKLSFTALSTYNTCPKKYYYHYKERLRERTVNAALVFGAAFDSALNVMLKDETANYKYAFEKAFTTQKINNHDEYLPSSLKVGYADKEWDIELIPSSYIPESMTSEELDEEVKRLQAKKKDKGLTENEKLFLNGWYWACLLHKGYLMLEAYEREILPNIKKIYAIQKPINFINESGDSIIGYIDLIAEWKDGRKLIIDNKTAAMAYDNDAIATSPQLSLYSSFEDADAVAFFVVIKQIDKQRKKKCKSCGYKAEDGSRHKKCSNEVKGSRCNGEWDETVDPKAHCQVLIDKVPARTSEIVLEAFNDANEAIHNGVFTRNLSACNNQFGSRCPFYNVCWKDDKSDLEKL